MGKGKGAVYTKFCYIKPGQVIFEFSGISLYQIKLVHNFLRNKCPFKVKIINILICSGRKTQRLSISLSH